MALTPEQVERHREATSVEVRRAKRIEAVREWKEDTPKPLQSAIHAGWHGKATARQKRLLSNWVRARVFDAPESFIEHFARLLEEAKRD